MGAIQQVSWGVAVPQANPPTWTRWVNNDQPSNGGDYETARLCPAGTSAIQIDCQTVNGVSWTATNQPYTCDLGRSGACQQALQRPGTTCYDYRVRYLCQ